MKDYDKALAVVGYAICVTVAAAIIGDVKVCIAYAGVWIVLMFWDA
jgi:hypothetical protein